MKEIPLSVRGKHAGKYTAIVDDLDYEYLSRFNWFVSLAGKSPYAMRQYITGGKAVSLMMHRDILAVSNGKLDVDHIDHNGLNNQRSNLRVATRRQNAANRRPRGKSRYLGVSWHRPMQRWIAKIRVGEKNYHIGYFIDEAEAAKARDAKARELHGEFANLNFK